MDHVRALGPRVLGTRMKRIGDRLIGEVAALYKEQRIAFDPSCMALFSLLRERPAITISEAAASLGLTHAAVSQKASRLVKQGYVRVVPSAEDRRSKCLHITAMGKAVMALMEPYLKAIGAAVEELLAPLPGSGGFMGELDALEARLDEGGFAHLLKQRLALGGLGGARIAEYREELKGYFKSLNTEWLETYFEVEEYDERVLSDPQRYILDGGGDVIFAESGGAIVGTVALMKDGDTFEVTKMGVRPAMQGRQIGKRLLLEILARAKRRGADHVYLLTHTKLEAACSLYRRVGFEEVPIHQRDRAKYRRCNARFELWFEDGARNAHFSH